MTLLHHEVIGTGDTVPLDFLDGLR